MNIWSDVLTFNHITLNVNSLTLELRRNNKTRLEKNRDFKDFN